MTRDTLQLIFFVNICCLFYFSITFFCRFIRYDVRVVLICLHVRYIPGIQSVVPGGIRNTRYPEDTRLPVLIYISYTEFSTRRIQDTRYQVFITSVSCSRSFCPHSTELESLRRWGLSPHTGWHLMCWMPMGGNNRLMWTTHTAHRPQTCFYVLQNYFFLISCLRMLQCD